LYFYKLIVLEQDMKTVQKPSNTYDDDVEKEEFKKENMVELAHVKIETNPDEYFESETAEMPLGEGEEVIEIDDLKEENKAMVETAFENDSHDVDENHNLTFDGLKCLLFIFGLRTATSEKSLWNHFLQFGEVESIELVNILDKKKISGCCSYITYKHETGLLAALGSSHTILGGSVFLDRVWIKPGKIKVTLPAELARAQGDVSIRMFFESFGPVIEFQRGGTWNKRVFQACCWITFQSDLVAQFLDGLGEVTLNGSKLSVCSVKLQMIRKKNLPGSNYCRQIPVVEGFGRYARPIRMSPHATCEH